MEFNAVQQFRPPSSTFIQNPNRHAAQIMYSYGNVPVQQQPTSSVQQPQRQPQPVGTWAVGQSSSAYQSLPRSHVGSPSEGGYPTSQPMEASNGPTSVPTTAMTSHPAFNIVSEPSMQQHDYPQRPVIDTSGVWNQKGCEDLEFATIDPEMSDFRQGFIETDEDTPIIDLRQYPGLEPDMPQHHGIGPRRSSESSFSMSSTGALPEVSTYEDHSAQEAVSYPDSDTWSALQDTPSMTMSPLASPRHTHRDLVRGGSRSRNSPVPHNNVRSSPYSLESNRYKRWSTGMAPGPRSYDQFNNRFSPYGARLNPHHSLPPYALNSMANFQQHTHNILYSQPHHMQPGNPTLFSSGEQPYQLEVPRPLPSQGLFRLLQSNADRHSGCSSHFADLSDPPDLYASLKEEPSDPPESDMNPSDPDLVPHEQDLRFAGDLYTPRWVRGHGNKREGWCGLCKPGRWLVLKNSAFWYDKSFTHGVSAATGAAFQGPQDTRRTEGNLDVWEGLCGSCGEWIALVSSKKKGTTWFRHAYKCHTHPKVKDGPKRRRETGHQIRVRAASTASTPTMYPVSETGAGNPGMAADSCCGSAGAGAGFSGTSSGGGAIAALPPSTSTIPEGEAVLSAADASEQQRQQQQQQQQQQSAASSSLGLSHEQGGPQAHGQLQGQPQIQIETEATGSQGPYAQGPLPPPQQHQHQPHPHGQEHRQQDQQDQSQDQQFQHPAPTAQMRQMHQAQQLHHSQQMQRGDFSGLSTFASMI
ncbi:hypothetical protein BDY21DRAFT_61485 [Lineolata rhizophorae]|uniref:Transcription regulator Rua1 C-terminal domain-containing protein n=1 Tax=Lineolata rhizophorae TaxID=578093 RepID=A0A6A6NW77_9PEZI|nr:hypothetical protein BDY21DRAFT_61485 [Lineolata rhizophorae]